MRQFGFGVAVSVSCHHSMALCDRRAQHLNRNLEGGWLHPRKMTRGSREPQGTRVIFQGCTPKTQNQETNAHDNTTGGCVSPCFTGLFRKVSPAPEPLGDETLQGEDVGHGKDSKHLAFVWGVGIEWIDCMLSACCLCIVHLGCLLSFQGMKNSPQKMGILRSHYKDPVMKQLYHIMSQGLFFMSRGF